jgi:hypothetical protein
MKNEARNLKVLKRLSPSQLRMGKIVGVKINYGEQNSNLFSRRLARLGTDKQSFGACPSVLSLRSISDSASEKSSHL